MRRNSRVLSQKFRLYPSKLTEQILCEHLDLCRWLYNRLLEELDTAKSRKRTIRQKETQHLIVELKKQKPELGNVYSKVLQMVNHQLWSNIHVLASMKKRGRKTGRLRFKGKWFKTLTFNQSGFEIDGKKLCLSKIGKVNVKLHRPLEGRIKGVIIKRELSGKWHAIFQCENVGSTLPEVDRSVGIDVGVKHFLTDTDGRQVENPRFYEKTLNRMKFVQHQLSRKQKRSTNRCKQRVKLARLHEKLVNQRNDFLHKLSKFYANNYDTIAVECLNITDMVRNRNLAGKILDASWGRFHQMLAYKAENAGRQFVRVNPRGTSQEYKHGQLDRDFNASLNILERGLRGLGRPFQPAEMKPLLAIPASIIVETGSPYPSG
jgi:putative transposase